MVFSTGAAGVEDERFVKHCAIALFDAVEAMGHFCDKRDVVGVDSVSKL